MSEYISKKKLKQEINDDCSRITTKSSYYDGMKQGLHELLNDIDDGRFNEPPSSLELAVKALEETEIILSSISLNANNNQQKSHILHVVRSTLKQIGGI